MGGSGRVGLAVRMWKKEDDIDFIKMVQMNKNDMEEEKKSGKEYSRNAMRHQQQDLDEVDTQGRFGGDGNNAADNGDFRFELRPIKAITN
jgi:hypothetical protein